MPIFVGYVKKPRTVHIKSLPDVYLLCPPETWTLTAEMRDYTNFRNDTFEWVQVVQKEGSEVTVTPIDTLSMQYPTGNDKSDKVFRFYVNKDTPGEEYMDAYVFGTPTSRIANPTLGHYLEHRTQTIPGIDQEAVAIVDEPDGTEKLQLEADFLVELTFSQTPDLDLQGTQTEVALYGSPTYSAKPDQLIGISSDPTSPDHVFYVTNGTYKVKVTYTLNNTVKTYVSPTILVYNTEAPPGVWTIQKEFFRGNQLSHSVSNFTRFRIIRLAPVESFDRNKLNYSVSKFKRMTTISNDHEESINTNQINHTIENFIRFQSLVIGN